MWLNVSYEKVCVTLDFSEEKEILMLNFHVRSDINLVLHPLLG